MTLPNLTYVGEPLDHCDFDVKSIYHLSKRADTGELYEMIKGYIGADCWGLKVNDEVIFDLYDTDKYRDILNNNLIKNSIYDNPHGLFRQISIKKKPAEITIYMFGSESYGVIINFDGVDKYKVTFAYKDKDAYDFFKDPREFMFRVTGIDYPLAIENR